MFDPFGYFLRQLNTPIPEYLQKLLTIEKKSELKKFCKNINVSQEDFVTLVMNANSLGYAHEIKYEDFIPEHLRVTEKEKGSLGKARVGETLTGDAAKLISKVSQIFKQRRYLAAHIFFNQKKWHIFYLDQRDIEDREANHWSEGAHIHFVNYLWPGYSPADLWALFDKADASINGKLHIRFTRQKRQQDI